MNGCHSSNFVIGPCRGDHAIRWRAPSFFAEISTPAARAAALPLLRGLSGGRPACEESESRFSAAPPLFPGCFWIQRRAYSLRRPGGYFHVLERGHGAPVARINFEPPRPFRHQSYLLWFRGLRSLLSGGVFFSRPLIPVRFSGELICPLSSPGAVRI